MSLRRQLIQVRAQLEARHALIPVVCADAVALWRRTYGADPDPWQRDVLLSHSPLILLNCCRQSGKSTCSATLALWECLWRPPALVLLVSPTMRQSQELGRKVFDGYRALGRPVSADAENKLSLELANGSRIVCLPGKHQNLRGFSAPRAIILDEASQIPDTTFQALTPMAAVAPDCRIMALSTPWGQRGWWYKEWSEGVGWQKVHITADQCPRISPEFLARERRILPEWVFLSEYYGVFGDVIDAVFRSADIEALLSDDIMPLFATGDQGGDGFLIDNLFHRS
jgi:Terminase large subunit, T4likevirus-type, N-terminal